MIKWYKKVVFENYVNFKGRARRSEYWYYTFLTLLIAVTCMVIDNLAGTNFKPLPYGTFYAIYGLAVFLPGLSVMVRRLHDVGKSGWFFFICLIPLVGPIWLLVVLCTSGEMGQNKYGSDPKLIGEEINEIGTN